MAIATPPRYHGPPRRRQSGLCRIQSPYNKTFNDVFALSTEPGQSLGNDIEAILAFIERQQPTTWSQVHEHLQSFNTATPRARVLISRLQARAQTLEERAKENKGAAHIPRGWRPSKTMIETLKAIAEVQDWMGFRDSGFFDQKAQDTIAAPLPPKSGVHTIRQFVRFFFIFLTQPLAFASNSSSH